jgi:SAM-dependent methyltransferase
MLAAISISFSVVAWRGAAGLPSAADHGFARGRRVVVSSDPRRTKVGRDDWDDHWTRFQVSARNNPAQAYRRKLIFELLEQCGPPSRLLDVGCGQGDLLLEAHRVLPTAELAGLELSAAGVSAAQRKVPSATVLQCDLLSPTRVEGRLDQWASHAVCSEVLEHVEDPAALLRAATAFMQPGCRVIITVPGGPRSAFDRHIGHRVHYTPAMLGALIENAGLDVEHVFGAGFPFFNLYRRVVILRGNRLVDDVDTTEGRLSHAARAIMRVFGVLFRMNLRDARWGEQIVGVARVATTP